MYCFDHFLNHHLCDAAVTALHDGNEREVGVGGSVATILGRELQATIKEWLRRVNLVSELIQIPLSDEDRTAQLPKLYSDLISRLRIPKDTDPTISAAVYCTRAKVARAGILCRNAYCGVTDISGCHITNIASLP